MKSVPGYPPTETKARPPLVLPKDDAFEDVESALQNMADQFGKRQVPIHVPQQYHALITSIRDGQTDLLSMCLEAVRASNDLIDELVRRAAEHEAYMKREAEIARLLREKYNNIKEDIKNEVFKASTKQLAAQSTT